MDDWKESQMSKNKMCFHKFCIGGEDVWDFLGGGFQYYLCSPQLRIQIHEAHLITNLFCN